MEYRNLGASGVKVSTLCLGAMTFGEADDRSMMHAVSADEATAHAILSRALEAGINFIDTADVYGQDGLSERVVGRWLAASRARDRVVLATKFRFRMVEGPNGTGASRLRIVRAVEESLRRLGTDRIDLYQVHMQDLDTPEEETVRALDDLVRAGKVLYLGASNYTAYRLVDSLWLARSSGRERYVALQAQYSLISPRAGARARAAVQEVRPRHPALCAARRRLPHRQIRQGRGAAPRHAPGKVPRAAAGLRHAAPLAGCSPPCAPSPPSWVARRRRWRSPGCSPARRSPR
jgi:aryl-alcohol dehydrogenase-like predicted oxidoreductase